ncbi:PPC domain-containing DNA-binding protein [Chloroflexota bacterium]
MELIELEKIRMATGALGKTVVMRLAPGCDLMKSLEEIAEKENIQSGVVLSGVGSLSQVTLRNVRLFPDEFPITDRNRIYTPKKEPLELLSLSGNISRKDDEVLIHGHVIISSGLDDGRTYGGHLTEGCLILSTCEVIIAEITGLEMIRNNDPETRVPELYLKT